MKFATYIVENTVTGGIYVGKLKLPVTRRWRDHKAALCANKHHNRYLQRSWNKYGEDAFVFRILQRYETEEEAFAAEQTAIAFYRNETNLPVYNLTDGGDGIPGWVVTEEQRQKQSESSQRRWQDDAQREKAAQQVRERFANPEERAAQSERIKAAVERFRNDPERYEAWMLARQRKSEAQQRRWSDPEKRRIAAEKQRAARARQRAARERGDV